MARYSSSIKMEACSSVSHLKMCRKQETKSKLCHRYLYLLNESVYFRRCFVRLLLQALLRFVHILLHLLPVHLHVATVIGDLYLYFKYINAFLGEQ